MDAGRISSVVSESISFIGHIPVDTEFAITWYQSWWSRCGWCGCRLAFLSLSLFLHTLLTIAKAKLKFLAH